MVGFAAARNQTPSGRTGTIAVGGVIVTILQGASSCSLTLGGTGAGVAAGGGSGTIPVTTTCVWTPSSNVDWITVSGGGTGSGTINYTVQPNPGSSPRQGIVSVYDRNYLIAQEGSPCTFIAEPASATVPASPNTGTFVQSTLPGCAWNLTSAPTWVEVSPRTGSGPTTVTYSVARNDFATPRTGDVVIGGATFRITQQGASCGFILNPSSVVTGPETLNGSFNVSSTCSYSITPSAEWIRLRSPSQASGPSRVDYTIDANLTSDERAGTIQVGIVPFIVNQSARTCEVALDPERADFSSSGPNSGTIRVTSVTPCWNAESFAPWIAIRSIAKVGGNGTISFEVQPNPNAPPRSGTIRIGPRNFVVTQAGLGIYFTADSIAHGASASAGPIAPGEVIVIYGIGMGPEQLTTLQLTNDGNFVRTDLGGTRVLFDGVPGPMIYTSANQISTVVPYSVGDKPTTEVIIEYNSVRSQPVTVNVAGVRPGIFTVDRSGTGPGAILNQDYSVNSLVPAARGSAIQIFATGEGLTTPVVADGFVIRPPFPRPRLPVSVFIDGILAPVEYAGGAPFLIAGVFQINVRLPLNLRSGVLPVVVRVGDAMSRPGVTVSVQ